MSYNSPHLTGNNIFASPIDKYTYGVPGRVPYPYRATTSKNLLDNFFVDVHSCPTWNILSSTNPREFKCKEFVPRVDICMSNYNM